MNSRALATWAAHMHVVEVGLLLRRSRCCGRYGVVEQVVLLQHEPDLPPEITVVEGLEVYAVVEGWSLGRLQQTGQALDQAWSCPHPLRPTIATMVLGGMSKLMSSGSGRLGTAIAEAHVTET